jgi:uncharacterized membrane protein YhaH (DUF805 family)
MAVTRAAAYFYSLLTLGGVAFQLALAAGAPWGSYAMGGTVSGAYPAGLRVAAVIQAIVQVVLALVVLSRAEVTLRSWRHATRWAIWIAVAFSAVSLILNLITPSSGERMIWAPFAFLMLASVLVVAISTKGRPVRVVTEQ